MASKRDLKKSVNYIMGDLFTECVVQHNYVPGTNKEEAKNIMVRILALRDDFVTRISHPEPGNIKGSYNKLRADINAQVKEIFEAIDKLN